MSTKKISFEDSLHRLKEISELLEDENTGLEESIKLYEEGVKLAKKCYTTLDQAEVKIKELKKDLENNIE
ncbi:MAG: exodeoxyribonuclease VII small subunit [Bacteroidota bacterium]